MFECLKSFIIDPHRTKSGFATLCLIAMLAVASGFIFGSFRLSELRAAQAEERKRINLVGWRNIKVGNANMTVAVINDTLSMREFLLAYYNGEFQMCAIPQRGVSQDSGDDSPIPIMPFKSSW
jgi:hypothetical protein